MSKTGVQRSTKDGGAHEPSHENKNNKVTHVSIRNPAKIPISNIEPILFKSYEVPVSSLSSEADSYVEITPPKYVVNDAQFGLMKSRPRQSGKTIVIADNDINSESVNSKINDSSNHSTPLVELDGDGFVGEDIFEMGSGNVGGVSTESISLPLPITLDSNYLGSDFSDNLKDFVFSVSDSDNLSKVDPNTSFDSNAVDGTSFSALLGSEDSISDTLQVSLYDDSDLVGRVKNMSNHITEDPTMTSVISTKRREGSVFRENELMNFTSLTKLPSPDEKLVNIKTEPIQNVFHPFQSTNDNLFLTSKADDKLNASPCKLSASLFPNSSIMTSLSNISDVCSVLNVVPSYQGLDDAVDNNVGRTVKQDSGSTAINFHDPDVSSTGEKPSQPATLTNQNVNVTTISISNKENNSIKILVHSEEGQNVYVINSSDLKDGKSSGKLLLNENQSIFAGPAELNQTVSLSSGQLAASDSLYFQSNPPSSVSGIFLVPVQPKTDNDVEKSSRGKKLVMCNEPGCNKTFKKASKLKVHKMLHTGERPFKCTFPGCSWAFTTLHKLKRHMESHEGRKDFVCDYPGCGHKFTTIYNLNTHRKIHSRPYTETCPEQDCGQAFHTKRQLEVHLRTVHGVEDRTYKCPKPGCDKVFFSSGCMGSHMRVHAQSDSFKCKFPDCDKEFTKLCRLRQHEKLHTGEKPYICNYEGCTWAFATASKLKRHQTKHTGIRKWQCHICRKFFMRSEHLKGHLITHSGDRPFVCPVEGCGNAFTAKSSLYVHLRKHDDSGKTIIYHCPIDKCDRHYACKASLRQHIMVKHCTTPKDTPDGYVQPQQGQGEGVINWLNLLDPSDTTNVANVLATDSNLGQEHLAHTEDVSNQTILQPAVGAGLVIADPQSCSNLISPHPQKMVVISSQAVSNLAMASPSTATSLLSSASSIVLSSPQPPPPASLLLSSISSTSPVSSLSSSLQSTSGSVMLAPPIIESTSLDHNHQHHSHQTQHNVIQIGVLQQQETMSNETLESGKKPQFLFDNLQGSARTDEHSNTVISQRAFKRWQRQKEIEAAKLRAHLESQSSSSSSSLLSSPSSSLSPSSSSTHPVVMISPPSNLSVAVSDLSSLDSSNVTLVNKSNSQLGRDSVGGNATNAAMIFKEIPDLELQAEGIQGSVVLDGRTTSTHGDSFMTELFIKDPETGMTYRQTQLLQDDPPTLCLLEDMAEVEPSHNVVLDAGLEGNLMEESLPFDDL